MKMDFVLIKSTEQTRDTEEMHVLSEASSSLSLSEASS